MTLCRFLAFLVGMLLSASAVAAPSIRLQWFGIYYSGSNPNGRVPKGNTYAEDTTLIPANLGTRFGFKFEVVGATDTPVPYEIVWHFPEPGVPNLKTGVLMRESRKPVTDLSCTEKQGCMVGWGFDAPEEMVPGEWVAEVFIAGQLMHRQVFEVAPVQGGPLSARAIVEGQEQAAVTSDICLGQIRVTLPEHWQFAKFQMMIKAEGPGGGRLEMLILKPPKALPSEVSESAEATLHAFIEANMKSIAEVENAKVWPFAPFRVASGRPASSMAVFFPGKFNGNDYVIQYLVAEPGFLYRFYFSRHDIEPSDVESDRPLFDEIVSSTRRSDQFLSPKSPDCH
jgi:hypothetical protein